MRLNKTLVWILLTTIISFAGNRYNLVDIGECVLPIDRKLEEIEFGNYTQIESGVWKSKYPASITIDKKEKITKAAYKKIVTKLELNKKIFIAGFRGLRGESKHDISTLIILKQHMILFINYPQKETEYMLEYCKRTAKTNK